jgi:hypothetical protein
MMTDYESAAATLVAMGYKAADLAPRKIANPTDMDTRDRSCIREKIAIVLSERGPMPLADVARAIGLTLLRTAHQVRHMPHVVKTEDDIYFITNTHTEGGEA